MIYSVVYKWVDKEGNIHKEKIRCRRPSEAYKLESKLKQNDLCLDVEVVRE